MLSCKIFEHFALQVGSSNWVHKTRIHSIQRWHHFAAKTSQSTWMAPPLLLLDPVYWSRWTIILYYIYLSVRWNTLLRNQIFLCQRVFYYTSVKCFVIQDLYEVDAWWSVDKLAAEIMKMTQKNSISNPPTPQAQKLEWHSSNKGAATFRQMTFVAFYSVVF